MSLTRVLEVDTMTADSSDYAQKHRLEKRISHLKCPVKSKTVDEILEKFEKDSSKDPVNTDERN